MAGAEGQYSAMVAASTLGDPCVYLNNAANGVESVDHNSSPAECGATGGQWIPPQPAGTTYGVANGNVYVVSPHNCGAAIAATGIGAVGTVGVAAVVVYALPELGLGELVATGGFEGAMGAGHAISLLATMAAAPLVLLGQGAIGIASDCF